MKIRWKLMILLLAIALAPLVIASALHRASMRRLGSRLASDSRQILTESARRRLQLRVHNYAKLLHRDQQLVEMALNLQAQAVEHKLAQPPPESPRLFFAEDIDKGTRLPPGMVQTEDHFRLQADGARRPMPVSYDQQACFLAAGADKAAAADDMARLAAMPEVYRYAHESIGRLTHWQYTALESGVHMSYPAHGGYPPDYDPRQRAWYIDAKRSNRLRWQPPMPDATSRMGMLTVSMPVRSAAGKVVGVTGIDVPVSKVFSDLELPEAWRAGEATLLVYPSGPGDRLPEGALAIAAEKGYEGSTTDWRAPFTIRQLRSEDPNQLAALRADAIAGKSGVRQMRYRGAEAMWAYGAAAPREPFPIIIVPTDRVVAQAVEAEQYVLDRTIEGLQFTGVILLGVVVAVVAVAFLSARSVTRPVNELAEAAGKLAEGDYAARVQVRTGDELQALGEAFNGMGPKLLERERMKRSLALAMEIQQHLLPQEPPRLEGFEIAGRSLYCDETGGDYYDFIDLVELGPGRLGIAVGDVTGHGIGAALLMASARAVLRSHAVRYGDDLETLFGDLNRHLVRDTGDAWFMTLFYGVLHAEQRSLCWTSAGHDPAMWLRRSSGQIEELPNTGIPLGIIAEADFRCDGPVRLQSGDIVLIGTDGIWEARSPNGEMFGKQRLREVLAGACDRAAGEIHAAVVDAVGEFRASVPQADDITLVVVKTM
jgi:sigma-B regulation protein RsbU (phosphoserine phosphatase)